MSFIKTSRESRLPHQTSFNFNSACMKGVSATLGLSLCLEGGCSPGARAHACTHTHIALSRFETFFTRLSPLLLVNPPPSLGKAGLSESTSLFTLLIVSLIMERIVAEKARKQAIVARLWAHATPGCKRVTKIYSFLAAVVWFFTLLAKYVVKQLKAQGSWFSPWETEDKASEVYCLPVSDAFFSPNSHSSYNLSKRSWGCWSWNLKVHPPWNCWGIIIHLICWWFYEFVYLASHMFNVQGKRGCGIDELIPETASVFYKCSRSVTSHLCPNRTVFETSPVTHCS